MALISADCVACTYVLNANTELIIPTHICMYNTTHNRIGLIVHNHSGDRKKLYYRKGLAQDNRISTKLYEEQRCAREHGQTTSQPRCEHT